MASAKSLFLVMICVASMMQLIDGRYLPTRGAEDSLDRLRELLKDILESDSIPPPNNYYDNLGVSPNRLVPKEDSSRFAPKSDFYNGKVHNIFKRTSHGPSKVPNKRMPETTN